MLNSALKSLLTIPKAVDSFRNVGCITADHNSGLKAVMPVFGLLAILYLIYLIIFSNKKTHNYFTTLLEPFYRPRFNYSYFQTIFMKYFFSVKRIKYSIIQ